MFWSLIYFVRVPLILGFVIFGTKQSFFLMASRNWLFTVNDIPEGYGHILERIANRKSVGYIVVGRERAPTTDHVHLQGFIKFVNVRKFKGVKKLLSELNNPRLDIGDGKAYAMMEYCKKDGDFLEYGEPPLSPAEAGKKGGDRIRDAHRECCELAEAGEFKTMKRMHPNLYTRYYRTWMAMHKDFGDRPKDLLEVTGVWIFGPSGSGKSHYARETYPGFYDKPCNKWFDNYQGERFVLIDDFDKKHDVLAHHLKRWADRYAFSAEIKGSQINLRPERIVVTSQYRISEIWTDRETVDALERRFIKIKIHIDSQGNRVIQNYGHS